MKRWPLTVAKHLRICLLGGFRVEIGDWTIPADRWRRRKAAAILKILALDPLHRRHREEILDLLWPDLDPDAAANNLHQNVHIARRILDPDGPPTSRRGDSAQRFLVNQGDFLVLSPTLPIATDVGQFLSAVREAQRTRLRAEIECAIGAYSGELLPDDRNEDWSIAQRESLRAEYLGLLIGLAEVSRNEHDVAGSVVALERAIEADPLFEEAYRALIRVYAENGQRAAALLQYGRLRDILRRELDCDPDDASQQLYQELLRNEQPARPIEALPPPPPSVSGRLPAPRTSFVGREQDRERVRSLLGEHRLVTLTGAGGCGKTRLAIEVARTLSDAVFVDLASLNEPDQMPAAIAAAIGFTIESGETLSLALGRIRIAVPLLVVLDNCEHLIERVAGEAGALLEAPPVIRLLATSREPLAIDGEVLYRVPSLPAPPIGDSGSRTNRTDWSDSSEILGYESVQLFLDRVRARVPEYHLSPARVGAIGRICARLDGIPLAIELAAARIDVLTEDQIAARLDDALGLLASNSRSAPARHRTLRAAADWGYALLNEDERMLFRRLGLLRGTFSIQVARALTTPLGKGWTEAAFLDLLAGLVTKSMVLAVETGDAMRYRLLEPLRQYAFEKLGESGEREAACRQLHDWAVGWIAECCRHLTGPDESIWLDRLDRELPNLRVVFQWAADQHDVEAVLRLSGRFWRFWQSRGRLLEGIDWWNRLLDAGVRLPNGIRATAESALGSLYRDVDQLDPAIRHFDHARALWLAENHLPGVMSAVMNLGNSWRDRGDFGQARGLLGEAERLARQIDAPREVALAILNQGRIDRLAGDLAEAEQRFQTSLDLFRYAGDAQGAATALNRLGDLARLSGESAVARSFHEDALALQRQRADPWGCAISLVFLAQAAMLASDTSAVAQHVRDALALLRDLGIKKEIAPALEVVAVLARHEGESDRAVRLFAAATRIRQSVESAIPPADALVLDTLADLRSAIPPILFASCWQRGTGLSVTEAVDEALAAACLQTDLKLFPTK